MTFSPDSDSGMETKAVDEEKQIQVMELFGPTIQGEGIMSGTVTHFLRTGGCPLRCTWCDSLFAVLPDQIKKHRQLMTTWEVIDAIFALPWAPYITFTGGDPAIVTRLGEIIPAINQNGMRVAVESQGMYFPQWFDDADVLTFSPKGPSSGNIVNTDDLCSFLLYLGHTRKQRVCIKVVVFNEDDFNYAMQLYERLPMNLYDAFYFTAGTPLFDEPQELENLVDEDHEKTARAVQRQYDVLGNQTVLADTLLHHAQTVRFNEKTHIGCQQHVLLWPTEDKGV